VGKIFTKDRVESNDPYKNVVKALVLGRYNKILDKMRIVQKEKAP